MDHDFAMDDGEDGKEEELPDIDDLPCAIPAVNRPPVSSLFKDRIKSREDADFTEEIAGSSVSFQRGNDTLTSFGESSKYSSSADAFSKSPSYSPKLPTSGKKFSTIPAVVGVKDNDGFLAPPPASTLLIRRTRTSSTGSSTYIVSPSVPSSNFPDEPPVKRRLSSERESFKRPKSEKQSSAESGSMEINGTSVSKRKSSYSKNIAKITKGIKGSRPLNNKNMLKRVGKLKEKLKIKRPSNIDPATGKRRYKKRNSKLSFPVHQKEDLLGESDLPAQEAEEIEYEPVTSLTWRPIDDFRLIVNTLQTNDLKQVHMGVKFSCRYTLDEIRKRWRTLLYGEKLSKVALVACRNIHSKIKSRIYADALFSEAEIKKLQTIKSTSSPSLEIFGNMLHEDVLIFNKARTPKMLYKCWMDLKELQMLDDQNVKKYFERGSENFSDFESSVNDKDLRNLNVDPAVMQEILLQERKNKKRIRILEQEIATWQDLADLVWEGQIVKAPEFDDNTYALIRGKNVRFAMAAKEITLGRRTQDNWVDADLSEEGCDYKVSRRQATIKMRALGDFVILNQGKHPMYIDGHAVLPGEVAPLRDQSVIKVSQLNFVFIVNEKLLQELWKKIVEEESNAEHVDFNSFKHLQTNTSEASEAPTGKGKDASKQQSGASSSSQGQEAGAAEGGLGTSGDPFSFPVASSSTSSPKSKSPKPGSDGTNAPAKKSKSKKSKSPNPNSASSSTPIVDLTTSPVKSKGANKGKDKGQSSSSEKKPPKKNADKTPKAPKTPRVKKPKVDKGKPPSSASTPSSLPPLAAVSMPLQLPPSVPTPEVATATPITHPPSVPIPVVPVVPVQEPVTVPVAVPISVVQLKPYSALQNNLNTF